MDASTWDIREHNIQTQASNGVYLTKALFREFSKENGPYTMYPSTRTLDGKDFISVYEVYMSSVNEYEAAMRIVGSMDHWRKLCDIDWFYNGYIVNGIRHTSGLKHWREDHAMKREAEALKALYKAKDNGNVQAAKYLHEMTQKKPSPRKEEKKEVNPLDNEVRALLRAVK